MKTINVDVSQIKTRHTKYLLDFWFTKKHNIKRRSASCAWLIGLKTDVRLHYRFRETIETGRYEILVFKIGRTLFPRCQRLATINVVEPHFFIYGQSISFNTRKMQLKLKLKPFLFI